MSYKDKNKQREYCRIWVSNRRKKFFKDKFCVKCSSKKNLELDHINPETKITHNIWSWSEVRRNEELKKCQVLCKECHKKKTSKWYDINRVHGSANTYKCGCRCSLCREAQKIYQRKYRIKYSGFG